MLGLLTLAKLDSSVCTYLDVYALGRLFAGWGTWRGRLQVSMNILIFQSCLILLSADLPSHCLPLTMKEEGRERKEETVSKREGGCWRRGTWKRMGKTASCTISHSSLCDHNCQLGRKKRWGTRVSERMSACMVKVVGGFLLLVFVVWGAREAGL